MSRRISLKELFTNRQSLLEVENDDDLVNWYQREENDDDLDSSSVCDFDPDTCLLQAVMSNQDSSSSELEDEVTAVTTGTETESEIISHVMESSLQKILINSSVVYCLIMTNGHLGFIGLSPTHLGEIG